MQQREIFQRFAVAIGLIAVLGTAFSFAFTPLRASQDEWWHLKTGKWIVENGRLPKNDIFTYTGESTRWYNHEWLTQLGMYGVFASGEDSEIGGVRALVTAKALVFTGTILLVVLLGRQRGASWAVALFVALIAADVSRRTIYPRPPIVSYFLFALNLLMLYAWRLGRLRFKWLWVLVPLMVVWANAHGMCLLGIVAAGAFAGGALFEFLLARRKRSEADAAPAHPRELVSLSLLTAALVIAAMANPSGYHLFFLGGKFMDDPILKQVIAEMLPPPFFLQRDEAGGIQYMPLYVSFYISVLGLLLLLARNRFRLPFVADYLLVAFFTYQALRHLRLLPLFAIASAGPAAWLLSKAIGKLRRNWQPPLKRIIFAGTIALAAYFVFAVMEPPPHTFFRRNLQLLRGHVMSKEEYPERMMDYIIRTRFPDRIFSEINYCGYMMWRLSPEHHKLFTDNRFDLFGSRYYIEEATVTHGVPREQSVLSRGWNDILDQYGVNFVVIARGAKLNDRLRGSGNWEHVYYFIAPGAPLTSGFNIWLRKKPEFAEIAARARRNFELMHPGWPAAGTEMPSR